MATVPRESGRLSSAPVDGAPVPAVQEPAAGSGQAIDGYATSERLRAKEHTENFPVAMRVLPARYRQHLTAVYGVVRTIDDLGDEASGDRLAKLDAFAADLRLVWQGGTPAAAVLRALVPTVRACALEPEPFLNLIEANRQDQRVGIYETYDDLRGYCRISAQPIGCLVLSLFGASSPSRVELSDRICDALQLVEHWQDVAEDRRAGRVYLPQEDLRRFGVAATDLDAAPTPAPVRQLMAFETGRAAELLASGAPLVGELRGWARLAVAGYVAGGLAAIDALRRTQWDVLSGAPAARHRDVARHALVMLLRGRRHG